MLMSIFLLLLISVQNLHGLICYSNGTFYFSRNDFNWNNFSNILTHIHHPTISTSLSCHVRITVNYNNNNNKKPYVMIKFHPLHNSSLTNIEFSSTINFFENQIHSIESSLDYICASGHLCDKIFLQNWARQLLNTSDNSLHQTFLSLWQSSSICQRKIYNNFCESYLCFTIYNELKNLSYGKFQCEDLLSTNPVNIHIKTKAGNIYQQYQCRKNLCTGDISYNSLMKNSTENLLLQQKEKQINELILKQTIIIVGILLIIGSIAYSIQCRKFKQGYRLTRNA